MLTKFSEQFLLYYKVSKYIDKSGLDIQLFKCSTKSGQSCVSTFVIWFTDWHVDKTKLEVFLTHGLRGVKVVLPLVKKEDK